MPLFFCPLGLGRYIQYALQGLRPRLHSCTSALRLQISNHARSRRHSILRRAQCTCAIRLTPAIRCAAAVVSPAPQACTLLLLSRQPTRAAQAAQFRAANRSRSASRYCRYGLQVTIITSRSLRIGDERTSYSKSIAGEDAAHARISCLGHHRLFDPMIRYDRKTDAACELRSS